ncbi:MAG: hypothetical protein WC426_03775 [Sulfuriferula sp.]
MTQYEEMMSIISLLTKKYRLIKEKCGNVWLRVAHMHPSAKFHTCEIGALLWYIYPKLWRTGFASSTLALPDIAWTSRIEPISLLLLYSHQWTDRAGCKGLYTVLILNKIAAASG